VGDRVRKMVVIGHLEHKHDEIAFSIHRGGHPGSHHCPGHGGASPKIQEGYVFPQIGGNGLWLSNERPACAHLAHFQIYFSIPIL